MTPRERVRAALNHRTPDRVPIDLGSTNVSSIHLVAYQNLLKVMGIQDNAPKIMERGTKLIFPCEEVLKRLQIDTRPIKLGHGTRKAPNQRDLDNGFVDVWGIEWYMPDSGHHYEIKSFPLADFETLEEVKTYRFPKSDELFSCDGVRERAHELYTKTDYALVGSFGSGMFYRAQQLRGYEQFLMDMLIEPEIAEYILDEILALRLNALDSLLEAAGEYLEVIEMADDLCTQVSPLISPELYREMVRPRSQKMIDLIKQKSDAKVMMHCCGAAVHFIPDYIEMGVDVLNPVQSSAQGMDTADLKEKYGDKICFWGGVDAQYILPTATPQQVREETHKRHKDLDKNGGYVACASHNLQPDVPAENILAMYETLAGL